MRKDGTKCIDCEIEDQKVENSSRQTGRHSRRKAYEADEELQISDIENEIAESEKQSKLFSESKLIKNEQAQEP